VASKAAYMGARKGPEGRILVVRDSEEEEG